MAIDVRPLGPDEARTFIEIHSRSVRGLAAQHYSPEVIEAWAGHASPETVARFLANPDGEIRLIAELDGTPCGLGCLVTKNAELRACYVAPEAARRGVGSALVREMERIARESGLHRLELIASLNAEPFYLAVGYESVQPTVHVLGGRLRMPAIKMVKALT